jgi:hypothetical protein
MSHSAFCGLSEEHPRELAAELAPRWEARSESGRHDRRGDARRREAGAGPKYELVFVDRLLATPAHLRTGLTHTALGVIYEVGSSTIGRAITEIRPLLAERDFTVPDQPGPRLRTLEDVFAYAEAENVTLRIDGMETQVRRPKAGRPGRRAFVSGKRKQNTIKTRTISDGQGRALWSGATRPGRMHDQTAMRTEGIAEQFRPHPGVRAEVDDGYRGLANEFPEQVSAPPKKPKEHDKDDAPPTEKYGWREMKRRQSSRRICVEHANAEHRQWRPLQRYTGRRETTPRPTAPSPHLSPTAPPAGPPDASRAPNSCSSARRPAESPTSRKPRPTRPKINRGAARKVHRGSGEKTEAAGRLPGAHDAGRPGSAEPGVSVSVVFASERPGKARRTPQTATVWYPGRRPDGRAAGPAGQTAPSASGHRPRSVRGDPQMPREGTALKTQAVRVTSLSVRRRPRTRPRGAPSGRS